MAEQERSDDAPYKLIYATTKFYSSLDRQKSGWWAELSNDKGRLGYLWHDDATGLGFLGDIEDSANLEPMRNVMNLVTSAASLKIPAQQAYGAIISTFSDEPESSVIYHEGELSALVDAHTKGLTAAGDVDNSPYSITVDDDGKVLGLVFVDDGTEKVRNNGEWEEFDSPNDPRFYDNEFHYVSAKAIDIYDRLVGANAPQTLDAFKDVLVD